jgi:hypothetical protein
MKTGIKKQLIDALEQTHYFEHFPEQVKCPICNTNTDGLSVLIGVDGTSDGGIEEAKPVHLTCLMNNKIWRYHKMDDTDLIYTRLI